MGVQHPDLTGQYVHVAHRFTYADAAARAAASGLTSADVYALALQTDDHSLWLLTDDSPVTWVAVGGGGGGASDAADVAYDNATSGLVATDVQAALDEVAAALGVVAPPLVADFAWQNQGGATAVDGATGLFLRAPATAGDSLRVLRQAAPATPYTITAKLVPFLAPGSGAGVGLIFRESGSGKLITCYVYINSTVVSVAISKWTNETTFSAHYTSGLSPAPAAPLWMRIADDGTNRIFSLSADGEHFEPVHTVGRTDFLTANQVGLYANASSSTLGSGVTVPQWVVA